MTCPPAAAQAAPPRQQPHPKSNRSRRRNRHRQWQNRRVRRALQKIANERKWHDTLWSRYVRRYGNKLDEHGLPIIPDDDPMRTDIRYWELRVAGVKANDDDMGHFRQFLWFFRLSEWERFDLCKQARDARRHRIGTTHRQRAA